MRIEPFALERYFARHEFTARHLLSSSDCQALALSEVLELASPELCRDWERLRLSYTESRGDPRLREAISEMYDGLGRDDVLEVVPEEGIFLLMHALLEPGDRVVCVAPAYQSLHEVARSIGCDVSAWDPDEERGWRFDLADLDRLLRDGTRLVVVNFPHNPTGASPSAEEYRAIVDRVRASGAWLLSDEMYRLLEVVEGSTLPPACSLYHRAVSLSGLSKSFGLPGLRVGWLATRDRELLGRVARLKDYTTICASAPSEVLARIALDNRHAIVGAQEARVRRNLAVLETFVADNGDLFRLQPPVGGSVCFPRYLGSEGTLELADTAVGEAGVMLVPSVMFGWGDRHLRLGLGREDFPDALEAFSYWLARKG